jgi:hypothetical protein
MQNSRHMDFATSSTNSMVPTRTSSLWSTSKGTAGLVEGISIVRIDSPICSRLRSAAA